jgi:hypothetical protein
MSSPSNKPKSKPSGTDSVSKKQSFQEWAMAGGGVPLQYKGREHVWDRKVKQYAEGGDVHMQVGGVARFLKGVRGPQDEALRLAQQRAALPPSKGGLGLPPDNTPEQRAKAMGFDEGFYHGSPKSDIKSFKTHQHDETPIMGVAATKYPDYAGYYAAGRQNNPKLENAGTIYPLKIRKGNDAPTWFDYPFADNDKLDNAKNFNLAVKRLTKKDDITTINPLGGDDEVFVLNPENIRSRFAAFDPFRKDVATAAAMGVAAPNLLAKEKKKAHGGDVHMDKGGAAFGVFPQMKPRRSKQDREAAKNVPVDLARGFVSGVLGAPGDIESLARLPYELITGKESPTFLPTSEDIEKRLPFRSEAPVSRAASGAGQLAGGFYMGPGSPLRAVGALPGAIKHGAQEFAMASTKGIPKMFIGPKAKTWDRAKADAAARLEKQGVDPVEIWRQTGTFRGADGIPRQEISDAGAVFRDPKQLKELGKEKKAEAQALKERITTPVGQKDMFPKALAEAKKPVYDEITRLRDEAEEVSLDADRYGHRAKFALEHPELYKAYPELADLQVFQGTRGASGERASLTGNKSYMQMDITPEGLRHNPRSSVLHEMQHAVQNLEDMAPGGNPQMAFSDPRGFKILEEMRQMALKPMSFDDYAQQYAHLSDPQKGYEDYVKSIPKIVKDMDRDLQSKAAMEYYKRLAGEAEARATQAREPMSASQRSKEFPYSSYDVPPEDLIVKKEGGPVKMAGGGAMKEALKKLLKPTAAGDAPKGVEPIVVKEKPAKEAKPVDYSPKVLESTAARFAEKIAAANPKLSAEEVSKKALTQATKKLEWERTQKPALEKRYGALTKSSYVESNPVKQQNTPEVVRERMRKANEFLDQPTEPWTPPKPELQAFDRSSIKDALEGFPGVEQSRFPRDKPSRANIEHVEELYSDPANRALIEKQIKRGLPLGGETFYASLYPVKQAVLEAGMPPSKFDQWIHSLAPASARNSIMNEMAVGQFMRDMNARGIPLTEENVAREMALYKEKFGIGLPLMPIHRQGVANVLEGGQNLRDMNLANIPTNYKIPTYGTQKAGDFANSAVLDVHEAAGHTQGSRFHPYFNEQGGFGNTEYGAGEQGLLGIAKDLGIPGGMSQAGRWFGGGELTGLKSPRGDALDLLEKQVAYTLQQKGVQPNPANVRKEVLRQIETGEGDLLPWYRKEGMPDVRETGLQRAEGGEVHMAEGGKIGGLSTVNKLCGCHD